MDDVLVTGKNDTEHLKNLEQVLERLRQHGMRLKKSKVVRGGGFTMAATR